MNIKTQIPYQIFKKFLKIAEQLCAGDAEMMKMVEKLKRLEESDVVNCPGIVVACKFNSFKAAEIPELRQNEAGEAIEECVKILRNIINYRMNKMMHKLCVERLKDLENAQKKLEELSP